MFNGARRPNCQCSLMQKFTDMYRKLALKGLTAILKQHWISRMLAEYKQSYLRPLFCSSARPRIWRDSLRAYPAFGPLDNIPKFLARFCQYCSSSGPVARTYGRLPIYFGLDPRKHSKYLPWLWRRQPYGVNSLLWRQLYYRLNSQSWFSYEFGLNVYSSFHCPPYIRP